MKPQHSLYEATRPTVPYTVPYYERTNFNEADKEPSEEFSQFLQALTENAGFDTSGKNRFQRLQLLSDLFLLEIPAGTVKVSSDNRIPILEFTDTADRTVFMLRDENFQPRRIRVTGHIVFMNFRVGSSNFTFEFRLV